MWTLTRPRRRTVQAFKLDASSLSGSAECVSSIDSTLTMSGPRTKAANPNKRPDGPDECQVCV